MILTCIIKQIERTNENTLRKLREYIGNLKSFAYEKIEHDQTRITEFSKSSCDCPKCCDLYFYSELYECNLPCIHEVLNKNYAIIEDLFLEDFEIGEIAFEYKQTELNIEFLDDTFKAKNNNLKAKIDDNDEVIVTKSDTHDYFDDQYANMIN